jgi:hypothetical protein
MDVVLRVVWLQDHGVHMGRLVQLNQGGRLEVLLLNLAGLGRLVLKDKMHLGHITYEEF